MLALPRRLLDAGEGDQYFRSESATVSWRGTLDENGRERRWKIERGFAGGGKRLSLRFFFFFFYKYTKTDDKNRGQENL